MAGLEAIVATRTGRTLASDKSSIPASGRGATPQRVAGVSQLGSVAWPRTGLSYTLVSSSSSCQAATATATVDTASLANRQLLRCAAKRKSLRIYLVLCSVFRARQSATFPPATPRTHATTPRIRRHHAALLPGFPSRTYMQSVAVGPRSTARSWVSSLAACILLPLPAARCPLPAARCPLPAACRTQNPGSTRMKSRSALFCLSSLPEGEIAEASSPLAAVSLGGRQGGKAAPAPPFGNGDPTQGPRCAAAMQGAYMAAKLSSLSARVRCAREERDARAAGGQADRLSGQRRTWTSRAPGRGGDGLAWDVGPPDQQEAVGPGGKTAFTETPG